MSKLPFVDSTTMEKLLFSLGFLRRASSRPLIREIPKEVKIAPEQYVQILETL